MGNVLKRTHRKGRVMKKKNYTIDELISHVRWLHRNLYINLGGLMSEEEIEKTSAVISKLEELLHTNVK